MTVKPIPGRPGDFRVLWGVFRVQWDDHITDAASCVRIWSITPNAARAMAAQQYPASTVRLLGGVELSFTDLIREAEALEAERRALSAPPP